AERYLAAGDLVHACVPLDAVGHRVPHPKAYAGCFDQDAQLLLTCLERFASRNVLRDVDGDDANCALVVAEAHRYRAALVVVDAPVGGVSAHQERLRSTALEGELDRGTLAL